MSPRPSKPKSQSHPAPQTTPSTPPSNPLINRFSLNPNEAPPKSTKPPRRTPNNPRKPNQTASNTTPSHDKKNIGANDVDEDLPPDIVFHKHMTRDKLTLLNSSPLSHLLSQQQKDAAAAELHDNTIKFNTETPPDNPAPLHRDNETLVAGREGKRERYKLRRKVRGLKTTGQLPHGEREDTQVGVMYLGHIPHGFYEKEIMGYFSQYGEVTRVRLSRSRRTARSRGFAFVEFADKEVAAVAAKSMDGYLMHGQKLVAKLVDKEKVHPDTFRGANQVFKKIPFAAIQRRKMINNARDPLKLAQRSKAVQKNLKRKQGRLLEKGIEYEFPRVTPPTADQHTAEF